MNNYNFKLIIDGHEHCQSFGKGKNAVEAFEKAFNDYVVNFPEDVPVKVLATNTRSKLTTEFRVYYNG